MDESITPDNTEVLGKKYNSLSHSLVLWFLLLSLLPLVIVSWISYQQANASLVQAASKSLEDSARLSVQYIQNWFEYRFMDLNSQAKSQHNADFLMDLKKSWQSSGKSLNDFVKSDEWVSLVDAAQDDLVTLTRQYDYFFDLFLIDKDGNILYSVAGESDLGTNLLTGPFADTQFARSFKHTAQTGQAIFSDLEHYAPSEHFITGFFTAPLLDEFGEKLGVLAMEISFDRVMAVLGKHTSASASLVHYLVGEDGRLRTAIFDNNSEILRTIVSTEQFSSWSSEHENKTSINGWKESVFEYIGPNGEPVIGLHNTVRLPGVEWALISEIDKAEALGFAHWLGRVTLLLVLLAGVVVIFFAVFLARRITNPIIVLAQASMKVAAGDMSQRVEIDAKNEIGQLAEAFNHMLKIRVMYENALKESTDQAQSTLNDLAEQKFALDQHAIVAITDVKGTIIFTNDKFSEVSGYSNEELIGKNHRLLNSGYHSPKFFKDMYQTIAQGDVWHGEIFNKAKDGHYYWVDTTIVPFLTENGKPKNYVAIRTDITKQKEIEGELIVARNLAEKAARKKSEFLANMSHEIRTPMNGVIGMTGLLLDTDLSSQQRNYAEMSMKSANALLSLINDILDFSKIEAGKLDLEEVTFDLQSMAEDVAELMAIKCRSGNLEMLLHYKADTPRFFIGDPGRVRQIMLNLLSNAVKFTEQGYILLTLEQIKSSNNTRVVRISVKDSGIGISEDKQDFIFNQFDQADGSTTRKYGGTGLGLSISKQLCEIMGGTIEVESQEGKGSTFSFTLRLQEDADASKINHISDDYSLLSDLNVLVVDDMEEARIMLTEQLSRYKINVEAVASGSAAMAKLTSAAERKAPFDFVITDFHMPKMDGKMLVQEILRNESIKNPALVFVASSSKKSDQKWLKEAGVDGYLIKPVYPTEIPKVISTILLAKQRGENIPLVTRSTIQKKKSNFIKKPSFVNAHVLLAEDNPVNQVVATEMLEGFGCAVTPAGNGLEALQLINSCSFDLIFMDCQMPEMDGFDATREVRLYENDANLEKTPIIAFTANAMQGDKEKCLSAGMDDYLAKPVNNHTLEDILVKWLPHKLESKLDAENFVKKQGNEEKNNNVHKNMDPLVFKLNERVSNVQSKINDSQCLLVWDKEEALERIGGKEKNLSMLIRLFMSDMPERVEKLQHAIDNNHPDEVGAQAHSIKGVSGNLSGHIVQQLSGEMEEAGKNGDIKRLEELFPKFSEQYQKLLECFQQELNKQSQETQLPPQTTTVSEITPVSLGIHMNLLAKNMLQGDYIDPEEVMALCPMLPENQQKNLLQLSDQISRFDIKSAIDTLNEIALSQQITLSDS